MIVPMKKLELLLYHRERERFLDELRALGVVHLEENIPASAGEFSRLTERLKNIDRTIELIRKCRKTHGTASVAETGQLSGEHIIARATALDQELDRTGQELSRLKKEADQLAPWGQFDPRVVRALGENGVPVRFFIIHPKKWARLKNGDTYRKEISRDTRHVYFITIGPADLQTTGAEEIRLPLLSLATALERIKELSEEQVTIQRQLAEFAPVIAILYGMRAEMLDGVRMEGARLSMRDTVQGTLLTLSGWLPAHRETALSQFLSRFSAYWIMREPLPDEQVPVLLKSGPFSRLFEPVLKIYSLPNYREIDTTPFFAPFFTLFVGLCIGDLAYGLIIFSAAGVAAFTLAPSKRLICMLIAVLGASTALCGIALNNCFSNPLFPLAGTPPDSAFFPESTLFTPFLAATEGEEGTVFPMMRFALVIGYVQLTLAIVLRMVNEVRRTKTFVSVIVPFAYIAMIVGSLSWAAHVDFLGLSIAATTIGIIPFGKIPLLIPIALAKTMMCAGLVLLFLFNNPRKPFSVRLPLGLWELYQFAGGIFSHLLSYLRLFALGLASGLLGGAVNAMAFQVITENGQVHFDSPMIIATILILLFGHSLNFTLAMVGAFVHSLRLTFLEFYSNLGFLGGGKPFIPFVKIAKEQTP
ncbi:MAG: hypothetical protein JW768_02440 [Chitinispirillaceae bacterium]|nr:hypothetical protein [Chitinispirillaceae bacterium]